LALLIVSIYAEPLRATRLILYAWRTDHFASRAMTIYCLGSINVDRVHRVSRFPVAGETLTDEGYVVGLGGKGANQAIAAARSLAKTRFIGAVGKDGLWALDLLRDAGVETDAIATLETATGHAVIYVDPHGENIIVIHGGANQALTESMIDAALSSAKPGDWFLAQNETNRVTESIASAKSRGLKTAYSAAPFDAASAEAVLPHLDVLAVNEGEAAALRAHLGHDPDVPMLVTTLGARGVTIKQRGEASPLTIPSFPVTPTDTTGAGDTFIGTFIGALDQGANIADAAKTASAAAAISVTRPGAADAIPTAAEVTAFLESQA
jgi:ribokinase